MLDFPNSPIADQEWIDGNGNRWVYNGEMWRRTLGVLQGTGMPDGGITGQVIAKASNANGDVVWDYIKADGGLF